MKPKTLLLLAVAGSCGLLAMLGVQQAMLGSQGQASVKTERVLVAMQNIESGSRLTNENVSFRDIAVDSLPEDPVRKDEEFEDRAAHVPLLQGDIVRVSKLSEKGGFGKSMTIPPGMRVFTISVDNTHTASGLLKPGDRVDVLVTFKGRNERGAGITKTKTLLEHVEVFATDDRTAMKLQEKKESNHTKNVSLLLSPVQVNYVKLAESKGGLSLAWRNRLDDEYVQTKDIDDSLLEELEGTAGLNEPRNLFDPSFGEGFVDRELEFERKRPQTPSEFLDTIDQPESRPASPVAPAWSMVVYNGNQPMVQDFHQPAASPAAQPTTPVTPAPELSREPEQGETRQTEPLPTEASRPFLDNGSLTEAVRSFWRSKKTAAPKDSQDEAVLEPLFKD